MPLSDALPIARQIAEALERCLDRDPRTRLRDVGEARVEIGKVESGAPDTSAAAPSSRRWREAMAYGVAGLAGSSNHLKPID